MNRDEIMEKYANQEISTDEAYKYFKNDFEITHDLISKYYICMIEFHEYNKDASLLYDDFKSLLKLPKTFHKAIYSPLIYMAVELDIVKDVIKYSEQAFSEECDDAYIRYAYAAALIAKGKDTQIALKYLDRLINEETVPEMVEAAFTEKIQLLLNKKNYELCKKAINEMYFKVGAKIYVDKANIELLINTNGSKEEIESIFEKLYETEERKNALLRALDYYLEIEDENKIIYVSDELLKIDNLSDKVLNEVYERKGLALQSLGQFEEAIEVFKMLKSDAAKYLNLGQVYFDMGYKKNVEIALEYFIKYENETKQGYGYGSIAEAYFELGKLEECHLYLNKCISLAKNKKVTKKILLNLAINYYRRTGQFKKAIKLNNKAHNDKIINDFKWHYNNALLKKHPEADMAYLRVAYESYIESGFKYRRLADIYMNGMFACEVDREKAKKYALKAYELDPCNCSRSILANICIDGDETFSADGYNNYINGQDSCPCSIAFYARNLYLKGQKQEALDILEKVIEENGINVSENIANLCAYISLELEVHLQENYNFLLKFIERRYQSSSLYVLMIIELYLGKSIKKRSKQFEKALLYSSKKEMEYYLSDDEIKIPFMNNN